MQDIVDEVESLRLPDEAGLFLIQVELASIGFGKYMWHNQGVVFRSSSLRPAVEHLFSVLVGSHDPNAEFPLPSLDCWNDNPGDLGFTYRCVAVYLDIDSNTPVYLARHIFKHVSVSGHRFKRELNKHIAVYLARHRFKYACVSRHRFQRELNKNVEHSGMLHLKHGSSALPIRLACGREPVCDSALRSHSPWGPYRGNNPQTSQLGCYAVGGPCP